MQVGNLGVTLPTLPEVLRIKAFLCLDRNATRDYLDLAALASHMGIDNAVKALWRMDELYPQKNDDPWAVRTQLVMQLAAPPPYDLDTVDLADYKGAKSPFDRWDHVADVCGKVSDGLLNACVRALRAEASPAAQNAQSKIESWRDARAKGQAIPPSELPGLKA
jgi:hypothetical protein